MRLEMLRRTTTMTTSKTNRGPVAHIARVRMTGDEREELVTIATLDRTTYSDVIRRAIREYAERRRQR